MVSLEIAAYSLCLEPRTLGERPLPFFIFIFYYVFIVLSTKYFKSIKTTSSRQIYILLSLKFSLFLQEVEGKPLLNHLQIQGLQV